MATGSAWKRFRRRLVYWMEHSTRHRHLRDEMEFHLDSIELEFMEGGMSEQEARAAAHRKFGNVTMQAEDARATWIARWFSDAAQDLKHAWRGMRREAGFTLFVIFIAGLGIGATSTIFSVVNAVLLRPLPFRDPARLVWITNTGDNGQEWTTQVGHYLDLLQANRSFIDIAGVCGFYGAGDSKLTGTGEPERLTSVPVTQNFFRLLGVQPQIGRFFTSEESQQKFSLPPAAVLTNGFWRRRFASNPSVLGQKITINGRPVVVVGVLPASFDFASIFAPGTQADLFIPWPLTPETNQRGNTTKLIGRLKPGVTLERARPEFMAVAQQIASRHPERNSLNPKLISLEGHVSGRVSSALLILACAVAVVMLIVCANLSNLQLARMVRRRKEMAVRIALGAGRLRLLRQMLTESVLLACCGAVLGLILAGAGTAGLRHLDAFSIPLLPSVRLDGNALLFTLLAAVLTGVLFGLIPAMQVSALEVASVLKEAGRGSGGNDKAWLRNGLVISEIALACMLLVGAGLLIRSFLRVMDVNLGFRPEGVAAQRVDPTFRFRTFEQQNTYIDDVLKRTRALPGVVSAGLTDVLPFDGDRSWGVAGKGQVYGKNQYPEAFIRIVTDGYFEAAGVRVLAGRVFSGADRAKTEKVAVINESLAHTLWPGQDAVGQMLAQDGGRRVIGVVADVRHASLEARGGSEMYLPMRQTGDYAAMDLVLRTAVPPSRLVAGLRSELRQIDPNLPVREFTTLRELVDRAVSPRRFFVWLLTGFACFALLLASLGIYAVISYSVTQRTKEIGIRIALGASAREVQRSILLRTLGLAVMGVALGMLASRILARAIGSLLYDVSSNDPVAFAGMGALLISVAILAGYIPARRASQVDPMAALRTD